jgi:hypothetical protein
VLYAAAGMLGLVLQMLALLLEVGFRNLGLAGWILGRGVLGVVRDIPVSFFSFSLSSFSTYW